ncbi:G2/M phase-specific E3 ubiquitin-protein ligase, partial [Apaloderma vittatum]
CVLCRQAAADPRVCGSVWKFGRVRAHLFCALFASDLPFNGAEEAQFSVIGNDDVRLVAERVAQEHCFVCQRSGATIKCSCCNLRFHLPCAARGQCVAQFYSDFRAFCSSHSPRQVVQVTPESGATCLICQEAVDNELCFRTMVCPTCQHAWIHRACIQGLALSAGTSCFSCPLCRDKEAFQREMLYMGIQVPVRPPAWDDIQEYAGQMERHQRCNASECLCPGGRQQEEEEG